MTCFWAVRRRFFLCLYFVNEMISLGRWHLGLGSRYRRAKDDRASDGKMDGWTRLMLRRSLAIESVRDSLGMKSPSDNEALDFSEQGNGTGAREDEVMCDGIDVRREQHVPTGTCDTD